MVEKAGIEPARQRLQGAPGALPVIPRAAAFLIILLKGRDAAASRQARMPAGMVLTLWRFQLSSLL